MTRPGARRCSTGPAPGSPRTPTSTPAPSSPTLLAAVADDPDGPAARELADRFDGRLEFGTAGLRGALGAGSNRMNRVVVHPRRRRPGRLPPGRGRRPRRPVVVGYDARHGSDVFAEDTAAVMAGAGLARAWCSPGRCPPRCWPTPSATSAAWPG